MSQIPNFPDLLKELVFTASRSDGPGGQNVNKVNSKITLKFDVTGSRILTDEQKAHLYKKLDCQLTQEGVLIVTSRESRSQLANKEEAIVKFENLVRKAFEKRKARKSTKPSKGAIQERITRKKHQAEKKKWRQKP